MPERPVEGVYSCSMLTATLTHIERTVSANATRDLRLVPFAAIDFAPVELNGEVFRLSSHLVTEFPEGDSKGRFEATYSDCKLFKATSTILPGVIPVPEGDAAPPHP